MIHDPLRSDGSGRRARRRTMVGCYLLAAAAMVGSARAETPPPPISHTIQRGSHRIYAREYPGSEPALVLMHGFPDDLALYDRLVPFLNGRHVVLFDFLGWGRS